MFYFAAIVKELTRKLTKHVVPHISLVSLIIIACLHISPAHASSSNSDSIAPLNRFPRMVQEYFVKSVRRVEQQANQRRATLTRENTPQAAYYRRHRAG